MLSKNVTAEFVKRKLNNELNIDIIGERTGYFVVGRANFPSCQFKDWQHRRPYWLYTHYIFKTRKAMKYGAAIGLLSFDIGGLSSWLLNIETSCNKNRILLNKILKYLSDFKIVFYNV